MSGSQVMPSGHAFAITPHDTTHLPYATSRIYVGGSGTGLLTVIMQSGESVQFAGLVAGAILPIRAVRVMATGTGVTLLVGLT